MSEEKVSRLKQYVNEVIQTNFENMVSEADKARFTVNIEHHNNRRLEHIAKKLGMKKTELVRDAINIMVEEFEEALGLSLDDPEYLKVIFPSEKRVVKTKDGTVTITTKGSDGKDPDQL